jgi:septal ring factor EnvC (AmiA/AmiB activator)
MSSSPFRDELQALQSALTEVQTENSELRAALSRQQTELEALRVQLPENAGAVAHRLAEENEELRQRISQLQVELATSRMGQPQADMPDVWAALERLFARFVRK